MPRSYWFIPNPKNLLRMYYFENFTDFVPQIVPQKMSGKLSYKIRIKDDYIREDGTSALFLSIYYRGKRKRLPLDIAVPVAYFDSKKQRVKKNYKFSMDYNLIIEKTLADLNSIEVSYRLSNEKISLEKVLEDLQNPSLRIDFNLFAENILEFQKENKMIHSSTYRQQKGCLNKIKRYKSPLLFLDINPSFLENFKSYLKNTLKNKPSTVESTLKNFKKFLHKANSANIKTDLKFNDIKVKSMVGDFVFLLPNELKKIHDFYGSPFINGTWRAVLQRYLFSCFTGLRIGDIEKITEDNFLDDFLVYTAQKTGKITRQKLNKTALNLIEMPQVFEGSYSREYINRELKHIAKVCGIKKRLHFHSSRHTFATNFLIQGGQIQNLQKLLNHSKIETTMIYTHVVDSLMNDELKLMDGILNNNDLI